MRKIIVICTSLVSLILTSHPVLAEQLRVDEFTEKETACGQFLSRPGTYNLVFSDGSGYGSHKHMKMVINGKRILFNKLYSSPKKEIFLSQDKKIKVQLDIVKSGLAPTQDFLQIDKAILTVKKGKSQIKLNVTGGAGC